MKTNKIHNQSISDHTKSNKAKQEQIATQHQTTKIISTKQQQRTHNVAKQHHSKNLKPNHSKQYHILPQESKLIYTKGDQSTQD